MATYTSSQSGNFSSSSTWGGAGVPGDGDRFDVSSAHTVTIDSGISVPTNGYADSYIYGILQSQSSTDVTLRMNGRLYIKGGGLLHLRAGATVEVKGTSGDQHGIWQENEDGASVIMEGSDGMPSTTTTSAYSENQTSLAVADGSNFAAGEWISIFTHNFTDTSGDDYKHEFFLDEGFWIHEVSGNTIYFRQFVGPEDVTVTGHSGTTLNVSNAKKFRKNQKIIFGTGSNRNIKTINDIDYINNTITMDSSVSEASYLATRGETIYLTGTEKPHTSGSKVRKIATVTTASSGSTSTTITVADASSFAAGDDIWIERRSEADGTTDYQGWWSSSNHKDTRHTISSISGNTLTLTAAIDYTAVEGALVKRLTRDVTVKCLNPGTDHGFFYSEYYSSNYNKQLILKDVYFKDWGNDDSNIYTGVVLRGYYSTNNPGVTLTETVPSVTEYCWIEGLAIYIWPDSTHQNDWGPLWAYDSRGTVFKDCIAIHGDDGISLYYEPYIAAFNCITSGMDSYGLRLEGTYRGGAAYIYSSRNYYGLRINDTEDNLGFKHIITDASHHSVNQSGDCLGKGTFKNWKMTGTRYGMLPSIGGRSQHIIYGSHRFLSGLPSIEDGDGTANSGQYRIQHYGRSASSPTAIIENDFEYNGVKLCGKNWEAKWDFDERAWRFVRRHDEDNSPGMLERVYVPPETAVRITAKVKYVSGFSGTYPYLGVFDEDGDPLTANSLEFSGGTGSASLAGYRAQTQYTASAASGYEEKQLTVPAVDWSRTLGCGVYSSNRNAAEGFWIKDFRIYLDTPYANPAFNIWNNTAGVKNNGIIAEIRNTFSQQKKRLGGRIS
jgi:hypothetical protein